MAYETIIYDLSESIVTITMNRPEKLNAANFLMFDELEDAFRRAGGDDQVRAIIVTGNGRGFCSGMDLSGPGKPSPVDKLKKSPGRRDPGSRVTMAIYDCSKPVIAAINGVAAGFGCTVTLPMDIRIAAADALLLSLRAAGPDAGIVLDVVSAAHRRDLTRAGVDDVGEDIPGRRSQRGGAHPRGCSGGGIDAAGARARA